MFKELKSRYALDALDTKNPRIIETVMLGQATMSMKMGHGIDGIPETSIACRISCADMREAHFHIKLLSGLLF